MKHIKLFEDFNEDIYIEDAKYIIISHLGEVKEVDISHIWNKNDLLKFELEEIPTDDEIKRCEEHLKEEGFDLNISIEDEPYCVVAIGNTLEEFALNWLSENYGNLERQEVGTDIFYLDTSVEKFNEKDFTYGNKPENIIFYITHHYTFMSYRKIWSILSDIFLFSRVEIQNILNIWLEKNYGLTNLNTIDWKNI